MCGGRLVGTFVTKNASWGRIMIPFGFRADGVMGFYGGDYKRGLGVGTHRSGVQMLTTERRDSIGTIKTERGGGGGTGWKKYASAKFADASFTAQKNIIVLPLRIDLSVDVTSTLAKFGKEGENVPIFCRISLE